jgi:hypothetical protein
VVLPETDPIVAVIVVCCKEVTVCAEATPLLEITATSVLDEVQVAVVVTSRVPPVARVAVAVKDCCWPDVMKGFEGLIAIEATLPFPTLTVAVPLIAPDVAVMVAVPFETPVTSPVLLTVATDALDEDQVTFVSVEVLLSSLTPVAVS